MKKLDGDLSARPGNFHQGLELSLNSRHPLDILNTGRNSVFLLKMFSVVKLRQGSGKDWQGMARDGP